MIDLQSIWPFALAAVVLLAVVILVLLLLLLRRSAKVSEFEDAEPPPPEPEPKREPKREPANEPEMVLAEDEKARSKGLAPLAVRLAFNRAGRRLDRSAAGNRHRVPFFLLLGADGSRDSDLLANAGLELPFGAPAEAGTDLGQGRGFWFLDRGVVLDFAGDAFLSADGRGSDEMSWRSTLGLLQKLRPKRPVDGIVLALSCRELLEAQRSEAAQEELSARAGRIYRKLWQMQQRLGFRLPVYLLVTGCERLSGFGSFCGLLPHALRGEMLGWSSPFGPDAAYRSGWVDEAFTAVGSRMDDLQMEVFADTPSAADSLFLLPGAVRSLSTPVRVFLDQLFKPSAYHESLILRGIYLCGREEVEDAGAAQAANAANGKAANGKAANGKAANGSNGGNGGFRDARMRRTFFLKDLLNEKSFREAGLALPATRIIVARNRAVRFAQAMTVAVALFFGLGMLWAWSSLARESAMLEDVLGDTLVHLREERQAERRDIEDVELKDWTLDLLSGMARMDFGYFGSVFVPSSWFSPAHRRIQEAITRSFEEIILKAIQHELEEEARLRIDAWALEEAPPPPVSLADAPVVRIEEMPELIALKRYVQDMTEVEKEGRLFNKLRESRDLRPLGELVLFAFEERLPESFYANDHIYLAALREAQYTPFEPARFRGDASVNAERLGQIFFTALYLRNPFHARLKTLADELLQMATVQRSVAGETERFGELVRRMSDVETVLSSNQLAWAFRQRCNLGPDFTGALAEVRNATIFDPVTARRLEDAAAAGLSQFQRDLALVTSPLTGALLAVRDGRAEMQLSYDTLVLQSALKGFLGQGFVLSETEARHIKVDVAPNERLEWNAVLLEKAVAVTAAYERFRERGLERLPPDLQPTLDGVALDRTRAQATDLIADAQRFQPISPALGKTLIEEEVQRGIGTFEASRRPIDTLMTALDRLQLEQPRSDLSGAVTSEANRLLRLVDRMLEEDTPYKPRSGNFAWWDGLTPASPAAWGENEIEMQIYLEQTRSGIARLAVNYAQPLLAWLTKTPGLPSDVRTLTDRWQVILDDLRDYEAKKPGNPVLALEDYIVHQMPKVVTSSCQAAKAPYMVQAARSLFASNLQTLSRQLELQCSSKARDRALELYHEVARYFNQRLAGRYPFTSKPPGPTVPEADPEDVRQFFKQFDRCREVFRSVPPETDKDFLGDARRFVENSARARAFFASFLDAEKPEPKPSFDVEAEFRILREREVGANQIIGWTLDVGGDRITDREVESRKIRWTLGEPVRLALRWASDGPFKPVIRTPRTGVSIQDRTVVYEYANRWSLLAALSDNRASLRNLPAYVDDQPVTLALAVFTEPENGDPASEVPTQVFLRLTVLAPGTTQALDPPVFPERAPVRDEIAEKVQ